MEVLWMVLISIIGCVLFGVLMIALWITVRGLWMYSVAAIKRPLKKYIEEIRCRDDYVTRDRISPFFLEAIVASEDFRFFEHKGFSTVAMRKAFALNVKRRKIITGGSGITQQLAKNLYFSFRRIYARKLAELLVVKRLEKHYSKMELLEIYVNIIEYGPDCYGIENAARYYYGHSAEMLSMWEAVTLASVLPSPRRYNPNANKALAAKRAGDLLAGVAVLAKMPVEHYCRLWEQGSLTAAEEQSYSEASAVRLQEYEKKTELISVNRKSRTSDVFRTEMMKRYYSKAIAEGKRFVIAETVASTPEHDEFFTEKELRKMLEYLLRRGYRVGGTLIRQQTSDIRPMPIRFAFYGKTEGKGASTVLEEFVRSHEEFVIGDVPLYETCKKEDILTGDLLVTPKRMREKEYRYNTKYFPPKAVLEQPGCGNYTAKGLVKYVKKLLTQTTCYLFGAMGTYITQENVEAKQKQYPEWYTKERMEEYKLFYPYAGFVGFDCSGLIKSFYFGGIGVPGYCPEQDINSQKMLELAEKKGPIHTLPEFPGVCLYMKDHVGVYVGNGKVVECTPSAQYGNGVILTKLKNRMWEQWFYCPFIDYEQDREKRKKK